MSDPKLCIGMDGERVGKLIEPLKALEGEFRRDGLASEYVMIRAIKEAILTQGYSTVIFAYYVQKLYEQARNYTPDELGSAVVRLADLDLALKGGSKLPGELEFARALIEITRPAEPAKNAAS